MTPRPDATDRLKLVQGTLDMLILSVLSWGPAHGHGIATTIKRQSDDELLVDHGSLYPALQRLEERGWIRAQWGQSETGREARFYRLTASGRQQLARETSKWQRATAAIARLLKPREA
jgi:PadR family transcriptional regulator, regulatory protein PadR